MAWQTGGSHRKSAWAAPTQTDLPSVTWTVLARLAHVIHISYSTRSPLPTSRSPFRLLTVLYGAPCFINSASLPPCGTNARQGEWQHPQQHPIRHVIHLALKARRNGRKQSVLPPHVRAEEVIDGPSLQRLIATSCSGRHRPTSAPRASSPNSDPVQRSWSALVMFGKVWAERNPSPGAESVRDLRMWPLSPGETSLSEEILSKCCPHHLQIKISRTLNSGH